MISWLEFDITLDSALMEGVVESVELCTPPPHHHHMKEMVEKHLMLYHAT